MRAGGKPGVVTVSRTSKDQGDLGKLSLKFEISTEGEWRYVVTPLTEGDAAPSREDTVQAAVMEHVTEHPRSSIRGIVKAVGGRADTVRQVVRRLLETGVLQGERGKHTHLVSLAPKAPTT